MTAKFSRTRWFPEELIEDGQDLPAAVGRVLPPRGVWAHVTGTDLVRDRDGTFYVLEDNMRCPSGVSYVLENRQLLKRTFPAAFDASHVRAVDEYPHRLLETLQCLAPESLSNPCVVTLTPGIYNSAAIRN